MKIGPDIAAVVTGGASGLGAATVRALAEQGARVGILDIDDDRGAALCKATSAVYVRCDITEPEQVASALSELRDRHGQERVLVNCAGIAIGKRLVGKDRGTGELIPHDTKSFRRVIEVNLVGTFNLLTQCAAGMMALTPLAPDGERGVLVSTASVAAEDGQIGQVAYAASKGGVASMTLPIARELSQAGIRAVTILPGLFQTPMFDGLSSEARTALEATIPFPKRLGKPEEYAALVSAICTNTMLNGVTIRLDGAIRLAPR